MMVRVKFAKYGPLRFTGHLDVLRFFRRRSAEPDWMLCIHMDLIRIRS